MKDPRGTLAPSRYLHSKRRGKGELAGSQGFTILEVALAIAILTALSLSTFHVVGPIARQAHTSREMEQATIEVKKILEKVQTMPFKDIPRVFQERRRIKVASLLNGEIRVEYDDDEADPLHMHVEIAWDSSELGPVSRSFLTVRTE
ncbi:MAG TPA: prepilin-type N-terminal cleavage/methylation domain-containing protein [Planctomycetota bacterium]|nr:prepilin-type N-terminal cleavage/methylation domain-containing protein [Planctomycetota bacterium]